MSRVGGGRPADCNFSGYLGLSTQRESRAAQRLWLDDLGSTDNEDAGRMSAVEPPLGGNVFSKSRLTATLGLVLALAVSGIAFGTAAENDAKVVGKVSPKKLDKKKFKKAQLFLGVENSSAHIDGMQSNPASEYISIGKNVKISLNKAPLCPVRIANGTPTEAARAQCPEGSVLGTGVAEVKSSPDNVVGKPVVTVFNGPTLGELQLHTYSDETGAASPTVPARVVKSREGNPYGQALDVQNAPETGGLMITKFNATLDKSTGVVSARCKSKTIPYLREVTYKDGTSETAELTQNCKQKGGGGGGGRR